MCSGWRLGGAELSVNFDEMDGHQPEESTAPMAYKSDLIDPRLIAFVQKFRAAAQGVGPKGGPLYPRAACNWSSEILGMLLHESGFGKWKLVKGEGRLANPDAGCELVIGYPESETKMWTHDWLEKDGVFIDPTADQFQDKVEFIDSDLPFIHRGESPLCAYFSMKDEPRSRRSVVKGGVHETAARQDRMIRENLGLK